MKLIIAALDQSEISDEVLNRAVEIAKAFSARVVLLHIAAPNPDFVGLEVGPQSVRDARANELRQEHSEFQKKATDICEQGVDAKATRNSPWTRHHQASA